uniref:Uncharacterized protein n=1 Tax=Heterosigma akashiwo TaxID=2829 RepID=A0A7S3Y9C9_HETAK
MQKQHKVVYPSQLKWARDLPCRILTDSELISLIDQLVGFDLPLPPGKVAVQYFNEAEECQVLDTSVLKDYDFEDPDGKGLRWSVDLSNQNFKKCKRKKGAGWPKSQTKWDELMARALEALKEALQNAKAAENATAWNQRQRAIKSPSVTTARPGKRPRTAAPSGPLNQNSGQKAKQKLIDHDVQSTGLSMAKSIFSLRAGDVVSWNEFILGRRNSVQDQIKEVHKSKNREDSYIVTHNRNHRLNGDESVQLVARRKRGKLEDVRSQKIIFTVEQFKLDDKVPKGLEFEVNLEHLRLAQAIENTAKDIEKEGKKLGFTGEFVKDLSRNTMNF